MKNLLAVGVCIAVLIVTIGFMPIHGESEIYDSVIRLHVVANSDSKEDQSLKLSVRDAVLEESAELIRDCATREDAALAIQSNLDLFERTAAEVIEKEGYNYPVSVRLENEDYPSKNYESVCFPSGNYLSLQILIGEARGQNWWCVLFPPLCLSAATDKNAAEDAFISVGLTPDQYKIVTETDNSTYTVRFKILESIESAKSSIDRFINKS